MAENSHISWTDHTFNPWIGCTRVSPACDGCYAAELMGTEGSRFKRVTWGEPGKGEGTRDRTKDWSKPRKWNRQAAAAPGRTFVFCASLADVFDNAVPPEWRRDLFKLIHETPNLTWLLLTKRPGLIVKLFDQAAERDQTHEALRDYWPPNAAIGCTVIDQAEADRDVPKLLATATVLRPAFTFLSMEPLLGPVDILKWLPGCFECAEECGWRSWRRPPEQGCGECGLISPEEAEACAACGYGDLHAVCPDCDAKAVTQHPDTPCVDWVITGGETDQGGHKARPTHPDWLRSIRDQCAAAGVPFHFKQWGEWQPFMAQVGPEVTPPESAVFDDRAGARPVWRFGKGVDPCTLDEVLHLARPEVVR